MTDPGGYATDDFVRAPKDRLSAKDIRDANALGLEHSSDDELWASFHTPVLQVAYNLGKNKINLQDAPVVKGIRYGKSPEFGISKNYTSGRSESGLSLAQEFGKKEVGSSVWFQDRKAYEYRGIKVATGSDGETIILPLHVEMLD